MLPLSNKSVVLGVVMLSTLLFLVIALPSLGLQEASIPSYGTIKYCANTRVGQFYNGTYYVDVVNHDGTLETVYKSTDADEVINFAIGISTGGTVFVAYTGSDYEIDDTIYMRTNVTLLLDNNVRVKQLAGKLIIKFDGTASRHLTNAHIISSGRATLYGSGLTGDEGIFMYYADNCSIRNIEITNTGNALIDVRLSDDNVLENIYGHKYSVSGSGSHGILIESSSRNKILNCVIDAEKQATSRTALLIIGGYGDALHNEVIGGEFENSATDNGIYICSGADRTDYTRIVGVHVSGNQASGHAGIKVRPGSNNVITGFICENNWNGMEIGTHMGSSIGPYPNSTGNLVQGTVRNNLNVGLILWIDKEGVSISHNEFDVICKNNGNHGILLHSNFPNSAIEFNHFDVISVNNTKSGVFVSSSSSSTYIRRNYFNGIFENNGEYGVLLGDDYSENSVDNRFDVVAVNNTLGDISDGGTRTRINGFGKEAAGVGNPPTASLWDIGDIVENMDDSTIWIKTDEETMVQISEVP